MTRYAVAALGAVACLGVAGAALAGSGFSDTGNHEHEAEIGLANAKGLFYGYDDGTFRPDRTLTNKQAEVVLRRLLDRYTDDDGNSTLTRAEAAVVLVHGVCGLDGDCVAPERPEPETDEPETAAAGCVDEAGCADENVAAEDLTCIDTQTIALGYKRDRNTKACVDNVVEIYVPRNGHYYVDREVDGEVTRIQDVTRTSRQTIVSLAAVSDGDPPEVVTVYFHDGNGWSKSYVTFSRYLP